MTEPLELNVPTHLKPGARLQHHKGGLYRVEGACLIEASLETGILYRPEHGDGADILWMRPAPEFDDLVPTPNGTVRRFSPR
jgi:hypothetical protein